MALVSLQQFSLKQTSLWVFIKLFQWIQVWDGSLFDNATLSGTLMETRLVGEHQYYFHSSVA